MKTLKINHIGIATKNLKEALEFYADALGMKVEDFETVDEQKVTVAFIPCGESRLEIMESTDPNGPVGKFIEKNGPGIHHVAIEVDDIDEALKILKDKEVRLIDEVPRIGAGGSKIAFIHPKSTKGVLLEICQEGHEE